MPPLESFAGSSSFFSFAFDISVSSAATSIIGLFSLYAFFAIKAAFSYPIIGFKAVTSIGFFDNDASKFL